MKKISAGLLAISLLFGMLSGCSSIEDIHDTPVPAATSSVTHGGDTAESPKPDEVIRAPVSRDYFEDVWRGDVHASELVYEPYDPAWFDEYTAAIYDIAENGATAEEFSDADYYLYDEIYYVYMMLQLADLAWCRDPADAELSADYAYAQEVFFELYDEYWLAMSALAKSEYAYLLEEVYHESYVEYFAMYEESGEENQLLLRESELINEYYVLMSEENVDRDGVTRVYIELIELRAQIAELYGYENYADYAYSSVYYRDYFPEDSQKLYAGVKEHFVPLVQSYGDKVWEGVDRILASDMDTSSEAVLAALGNVLPLISPQLNEAYEYMREYELYDIEYDSDKVEMGFTTTLYYLNQPYIFNSAYDEFYDYIDMIHEFGHFANAYYTMGDLLFGMADMDLSELQSQGLEMLFTPFYDRIFGEYADEAEDYVLLRMVYSVIDGAMYDEFQQRVYAEEDITAEKLNEIFSELYLAYGYEPYPGYETEWMDVVHNFEQPFYYISYCVSALGALEIYEQMQADWTQAVDTYLKVCAMDTEYYYFSEALEETGLGDAFDPASYGKVAASLLETLN